MTAITSRYYDGYRGRHRYRPGDYYHGRGYYRGNRYYRGRGYRTRYRCGSGTTGAIIGGATGALIGREIGRDGRRYRAVTAATGAAATAPRARSSAARLAR